MSERLPITLQRIQFEEAAEAYLRQLREEHPEHFMESTAQAQQRKIFVESFDLVAAENPAVHPFNELLVQWRRKGSREIRQVVPDNMVVLCDQKLKVEGSYDIPLQPAGPLWVLEYVSKSSKRKDYEESHDKYEQELKVPYYLTFYPDNQELTLRRHNRRRYVTVTPNAEDRYALPELEVELGLVDGWVRFWFRGRLLPLPPELQRENDELRRQLLDARRRADDEGRRADNECTRANLLQEQVDRLQAELARLQSEQSGS